jgi:tRNA (guanine26-N2/guanine27-N2)-dimethyltransferase
LKNLKSITEGKTRLMVPRTASSVGPGSKSAVFFNPAMASNRDVSVLYARCRAKTGWRMLDALGGTGARGIRLAVEAPKMRILINDRVPEACKVIRKNIDLNKLDGIETAQQDLFTLLPTGKWDWIDIDTYGSPVAFVDQAVRRLAGGGTLSVTATDTAPLCGTHAKTCKRRYMARPLNSGCRHETGLRILVGNIIRRAAVMDIALVPELAYFQGHFFRCYFMKKASARQADAQLGELGHLELKKGEYAVSKECPEGNLWVGPLWLGDLFDRKLVRRMLAAADESTATETRKLLAILKEELTQPPYHYDTDELARSLKVEPPKTMAAVEMLKERGHKASLVHYSTKGFRTDAVIEEIKDALT